VSVPAPRPAVDRFGRRHRDLRISITDRCNLRCTYCMPAEGLAWLDRGDLLGVDEITRIARICVETFGFDAIRLTGGEPTVRADLVEIVTRLAPLGTDLALTTNGTRLDRLAGPLAAAGLRRVNVSLDSLRPERFEALTRRDDLHRVLVGIRAAVAAGLRPVKVNVVVVRGSNDDELVELARFGRDEGATVRFIEFMPLDADRRWDRQAVVAGDEIVERIGEVFPLERIGRSHEPAERFRYLDGGGEIGVISSVTDAFCSSCDRIRLTADGQVRACLFSTAETDLRALLRGGADDRAVADAIAATVDGKWAGHGITEVSFRRPERSMSQIGG
jgi:cyclic pyranopterin phosphate synthase